MKPIYIVEDIIPKSGQFRDIHHYAINRTFIFLNKELKVGEMIWIKFQNSEYDISTMHTSTVEKIVGQIGDDKIIIETMNTFYTFTKKTVSLSRAKKKK